jgi:hypothetical protein
MLLKQGMRTLVFRYRNSLRKRPSQLPGTGLGSDLSGKKKENTVSPETPCAEAISEGKSDR